MPALGPGEGVGRVSGVAEILGGLAVLHPHAAPRPLVAAGAAARRLPRQPPHGGQPGADQGARSGQGPPLGALGAAAAAAAGDALGLARNARLTGTPPSARLWSEALRQEFFEQSPAGPRKHCTLSSRESALLISSIAWSSGISSIVFAQRAGDEGAERAGFFGVVDRPQQAGADRPGQLGVVDPVALRRSVRAPPGSPAPGPASRASPRAGRRRRRGPRARTGSAISLEPSGSRQARCLQGSWLFCRRRRRSRRPRGRSPTSASESGDRDRDQQLRPQPRFVDAHRSTLRARPIGISASRPSSAAEPERGAEGVGGAAVELVLEFVAQAFDVGAVAGIARQRLEGRADRRHLAPLAFQPVVDSLRQVELQQRVDPASRGSPRCRRRSRRGAGRRCRR